MAAVTTAPAVEEKSRLAPRYRVLVHNDPVTTMEFVVKVLRSVFGLEQEQAFQVMMDAHRTGVALVAVLPLEQAEFKVERAHSMARAAKYPLTFTYEPES
jgi:ATP-dependent Clp protease adaptor protein ClpS